MIYSTPIRYPVFVILACLSCYPAMPTAAETISTVNDPSRILLRKALPQGLSVEINTLGPYRYIMVHFREFSGDYTNDDPSLGDWSIQIPELIGNSDGFIFGFDPHRRWEPVPDEPNAIHYENESHPIDSDDVVAFAGQREMINRQGRMKYHAKVTVSSEKLDIKMSITNLEDEPTDIFTDICNRFFGRGNVWDWQNRTLVEVEDEWILARRLFQGDGFIPGVRYFVKSHLPSPAYMHEFVRNSANNPQTQIMTSPYICQPLQSQRHTIIYGSPQGSMVFFNPTNPCLHSDAWTADVGPGETIVQKTTLRVYALPVVEAIRQFEREMAGAK